MRSRIVGMLVGGLLAVASVATSGDFSPPLQTAVTYLTEPTLIGSTIVQGPVLIIHDNARMKRGLPCTTIYLFEPRRGPGEEIASFHCVPTPRGVAGKFIVKTRPNVVLGFGCILTEFQFKGEVEAHGVPTPSDGA